VGRIDPRFRIDVRPQQVMITPRVADAEPIDRRVGFPYRGGEAERELDALGTAGVRRKSRSLPLKIDCHRRFLLLRGSQGSCARVPRLPSLFNARPQADAVLFALAFLAVITASALGIMQHDPRILTRFWPQGLWHAAHALRMVARDVLGRKIPTAGRPVL
jgi:hypothetical protein